MTPLFWQLLRTEGPAAVRDRLLDRLAYQRRRRSFRELGPGDRLPKVEVLNVLPTPPRPDWGGVQTQLLRRLEAEAELKVWALLYRDGSGFRVEVRDGQWQRSFRIEAIALVAAVDAATARLGANLVHLEQAVGFELDQVLELAEGSRERPLVLSVHDFGLFCRRPHLIERPQMRFCHFSRDEERCLRCLRHDWDVAADAQERWRSRAQRLLDSAAAVIYPSEYLRRAYGDLFHLDPRRQHVVAPPVVVKATGAPPARQGPIRHLAYVGSVKAHKGAHILVELIERLRSKGHSDLRWSVYGGGDPTILRRLRSLSGIRVRGYYRAGSLPRLLRRHDVDLALLLSIWPESYALTLDECVLAGVPVAAFDHGAPGERLREWGGVLVATEGGAEAFADAIDHALHNGTTSPPAAACPACGEEAARRGRKIYALANRGDGCVKG